MDVNAFVRKEVSNQGFDLNTVVGQERVEWMNQAWGYAVLHADEKPTIHDVLELGWLVERELNSCGFRACNVEVGGRHCPHFSAVDSMMKALFRRMGDLAPLEFYYQFEVIHPFLDGNGRVGKVLLCWLLGTLDDPEMPSDLFGSGVP
ncbi:hypothetical protein LCGC14_3168540 [marine sediment metagenome]|uniref:Fido domain-containing protein n=1 Tax=marine sediment metagenome TaxID=412755 RepID=A0A0F8XMR1_9ZZZZ